MIPTHLLILRFALMNACDEPSSDRSLLTGPAMPQPSSLSMHTQNIAVIRADIERDGGHLQEGLVALWRGWVPSVIGVIPYVGLNFAVYETLKDTVIQMSGAQRPISTVVDQSLLSVGKVPALTEDACMGCCQLQCRSGKPQCCACLHVSCGTAGQSC